MKQIIGTSHFVSLNAANSYYSTYGYPYEAVQRKIDTGEIAIGPPVHDKDKYALHVIKGEGRYSLHSLE